MQIHVINRGDSIWKISQMYSTPPNRIIEANQISNPNRLVIGQSLVIPIQGSYHWIQPGETLFSISRKYNISLNELIRINNITNPNQVFPGARLYIPASPKKLIETGAFIDPQITGDKSADEVNKVGSFLSNLPIFSYAVKRDGSLSSLNDVPSINATKNNRVLPIMVLTNFEDGTFSTELATTIFSDEELQDKVLNNALNIMKQKGYRGIVFDFEYLGAQNKEPYNQFIKKAADLYQPMGYFVSSALAPKISATQPGTLYEGHDYKTHGEILDSIYFMTYEWGWSGGPPMAVAPINEVERVLNYAVSQVPKDKILMGIPLYGYDWTLPYVKGGQWAKVVSPQQAIKLADKYGATIKYDATAQSPYFNYYDENGNKHEVWFEDARSIQAKFNLAKKLGIRGFFYWVLGREFPQNWLLIKDNFNVTKYN